MVCRVSCSWTSEKIFYLVENYPIVQKLLKPVTWKVVANEGMEGQGHFLTLAPGHLHMKIKTCFSKKLVGYFEPNFVCKLSWKSMKMMLVTWSRWPPSAGHMIKMAPKPIHGKFLRNCWTNFHETWYVAFWTPAYPSFFKWWPWVDLDLFYGKVKFGNISFYIEKCHSDGFFENFAPCSGNWLIYN